MDTINFPILDVDRLTVLNDRDFFNNFSYIMHIALLKDLNLYTFLIDKMYEICERDKDVLSEVCNDVNKNLNVINVIINKNKSVLSPLSFGSEFANILALNTNNSMMSGEYLSLGTVATAFISYKKNYLTKEEYYEIRDMFVPFYLPISVDMLDIKLCLSLFKEHYSLNSNGCYDMVLLKKIGKTCIDNTISLIDIEEAFNEINFDEAW